MTSCRNAPQRSPKSSEKNAALKSNRAEKKGNHPDDHPAEVGIDSVKFSRRRGKSHGDHFISVFLEHSRIGERKLAAPLNPRAKFA